MTDDDLFTVDAPPATDAPSASADAPYGYKDDGTPYKRKPNAAGTRKARTPKATPAAAPGGLAFTTVTQLWSMLAGILAVFGRFFNSTPLMADAIVVNAAEESVVPPLSKVVANNEQLMELCERLSKVTPGVEAAMALVPVATAIAINHRLIPGSEGKAEALVKAAAAQTPAEEPTHVDPTD